ncbi:hypothetical protein DEJ23_07725 [Curtobacterium sp. MCSS17_008]|uniref:CBU_0592 family membrane protein n=1 Tax=Curtobacterium sp. MCSS17_008 TaxID=2175647 RepID=UPI000DA7C1D6|nr:hypothetical protein [Curtobacterium sp. MCSS17_008]PZF57365.1 hypothetical protein DEJ23_07725 [Curtobacterium sp. MCSS17_008]
MLVGIVEFLGWFGAVTVLAGYLLFSLGKIPNGPLYQLLNLVGGLSVAINVAAHHAIPSTIVNGVWAIVAVVVLVRMARTRRATRGRVVEVPASVALHAEPPATTAVLPIVGPALRDHEAEATDPDQAEPRLPADAAAASSAVPAAPSSAAPAAPLTESIPVITATIALALVAAAQEQADQASSEQDRVQRDQVPTVQ